MKNISWEIARIHERNRRVEMDKAWEISWTRRTIIVILTYLVIVIFFFFAGLPNPFINSIVPALAFVLSSSSLPFFKKIWMARR
jgi:hypothetical protein